MIFKRTNVQIEHFAILMAFFIHVRFVNIFQLFSKTYLPMKLDLLLNRETSFNLI